jgi:hypothetical protein
VVLRVGCFDEGPDSLDHEATWLMGHTDRVTFGTLSVEGNNLLVPATLHLSCRHLGATATGEAQCRAHGFEGPMPPVTIAETQPRQLEEGQFHIVEHHRATRMGLSLPLHTLPVLQGDNPCATAPCRTADNRRGSACCRDLQIEIMCRREEVGLEALVRSRRSPYLCKVSRDGDLSLEAEIISACGYLDNEGRNCSLHGRTRPDGRPAKPDLCSEWPLEGKGLHPGCVFGPSV